MNQHEFEARVLHLWMTTRVPMTRANLLFYTRAPRRRVDRWLDEMVRGTDKHPAVLDFDSDDDGEMIWTVRGAVRPQNGPARIEDVLKLEQLSSEVGRRSPGGSVGAAGAGMVLSGGLSRALASRRGGLPFGEKSLVASGALSFFLGPAGWIYAGSLREAIPAAAMFLVLIKIVPVLFYLLGPLMPISAVIGVLYAMRYNQTGRRAGLLTDGDEGLVRRR